MALKNLQAATSCCALIFENYLTILKICLKYMF